MSNTGVAKESRKKGRNKQEVKWSGEITEIVTKTGGTGRFL